MRLYNKADIMGIDRLAASRMRIRYLAEEIDIYLSDPSDVSQVWFKEAYTEFLELVDTKYIIRYQVNNNRQVIDKDIALRFPIENIVQFDGRGKAVAFCHNDANPSLSWNRKSNRATCFVCGKSFNPIDVLMFRDGYSFREAVIKLGG